MTYHIYEKLSETQDLELIIDALSSIKSYENSALFKPHTIPVLSSYKGNITSSTDRVLQNNLSTPRDMSQYREITREEAHDFIMNRYLRLFDFYERGCQKYKSHYEEARHLYNMLEKEFKHGVQRLNHIKTIYTPIYEYCRNFYITTKIDLCNNNIFVVVRPNKLSPKNYFLTSNHPEFDSESAFIPLQHIRHCPTCEYSTDLSLSNLIKEHPYDFINILVYTTFATYSQQKEHLVIPSHYLNKNNFRHSIFSSRLNTLVHFKL